MTTGVQQVPQVFGEFTADGTLSVPAGYAVFNVTYRELNALALPARNLFLGTTNGGSEVATPTITASVSNCAVPNFANSVFLTDTTLYLVAGTKTITDITAASPAVVTYSGTDTISNGMTVALTGIVGMTQLNGTTGVVANLNTTANTFELTGVDSSAFTAYSSGGTIGGWNGAKIRVTLSLISFY